MSARYASYLMVVVLGLSLAFAPRAAQALEQPTGKVILTLSGNITHTNRGDKAVFDRAMLEGLGLTEVRVTTPWTDGEQQFVGVLGRKILDAVGARGETITARAINDYQVKIPAADLRVYPVLLALKHNGKYMRVRDKGPIWIIYPRDTHPELDTDQITDRWVWQLSEMVIQ